MTPEPFEEFRYSGCETSSHSLQPIVLCLWLPLSFDCSSAMCLELSVSFLLELRLVTLKFGLGQALWNFLDPARTGEQHHSAWSQGCLE